MLNERLDPLPVRPSASAWLRDTNDLTRQFLALGSEPGIVSLAGGLPATELYPVHAIQQATLAAFETHGTMTLEYGPLEGLPALRELIAARASAETGAMIQPCNVLVTSGSMQGLNLVGKVLVDPGDVVVAQSPTYLGALDAWRPRHPIYRRLDWDALDEGFEAMLANAKFVYTVPNYSNPTGRLVSQNQRASLLDRVLKAGTWLLEDDPYRTLVLDGEAGASILEHYARRSHGPYEGPVIYLGTVSKSVAPGLRVGWIIAEAGLIEKLALAKQSSDLSSSMFTQAIVYELLMRNIDRDHAANMVSVYRERRDVLCDEAAQRLSEWFEWEVPVGGMFVWLRSRNRAIDTDALYRFAIAEKVAFVPSSVFDFSGEDRFAMRLNFTRSSPTDIAEGVRRLQRAVLRYWSANGGGSSASVKIA